MKSSNGQSKEYSFSEMEEGQEQLVIIGSGCAGLSAAIYAARAQLNPLVVQGNMPGGLLTQTTEVENFPGFPEGISGMELMDRMQAQAQKFGVRFTSAALTHIKRLEEDQNQLSLSDGQILKAKSIIIATGSQHRFLGLPEEQDLLGGKGLSVCATCDGFFYRNETVSVIGGGDSACEESLYLSKLCQKVYLIHRRDTLRASKIMADRVLANKKIEMVWESVPQAFKKDTQGFLSGIQVFNKKTQQTRLIECKGAFLAIGWEPNTEVFKDFLSLAPDGYIVPNRGTVETEMAGVFAAGDCVDKRYRQACVAAGMGVQAALEAERWLLNHGNSEA